MTKLLIDPGYQVLMNTSMWHDLVEAKTLLLPLLDKEVDSMGVDLAAALCYLIGVRQGIHDERARRRGSLADRSGTRSTMKGGEYQWRNEL
jgi:hypothetical protein